MKKFFFCLKITNLVCGFSDKKFTCAFVQQLKQQNCQNITLHKIEKLRYICHLSLKGTIAVSVLVYLWLNRNI